MSDLLKNQFGRLVKYNSPAKFFFNLLPFTFPDCPICGFALRFPDMHEVILTRGDVQKMPDEVKEKIYVRENCVLVHTRCHQQAATENGQRKCIEHLLKHEGYSKIIEWLESLKGLFTSGGLIDEAQYLVQRIYNVPF